MGGVGEAWVDIDTRLESMTILTDLLGEKEIVKKWTERFIREMRVNSRYIQEARLEDRLELSWVLAHRHSGLRCTREVIKAEPARTVDLWKCDRCGVAALSLFVFLREDCVAK